MAGAPLVVGALSAVAIAGLAAVSAGAALVESQRLAGAADAAALAGGDALLGWVAGEPCAVASRIAEANRAPLASCTVEGLELLVSVSGTALGMPMERSARAGARRS
jgi:secretion/DNA translocation related TadE-like protein